MSEPGAVEVKRVSRMNIANILTVARIALVPVFAWVTLFHPLDSLTWRWIACGLFVLAAVTDKVDGYLARSRGLITDLGKLLDPIADKALTGAAFILLAWPLREIPWWVPAIILFRELGITIMRMRLRKYEVMPAGRGGKLKTLLQSVAIGIFLLPLFVLPNWVKSVGWVFLGAALAVTVVTGVDYAIQGYRIRRNATGRAIPESGRVAGG